MPIKVACPSCDQGYSVAETMEGKRVRCKKCSEMFEVTASLGSGSPPAGRRTQGGPAEGRRQDPDEGSRERASIAARRKEAPARSAEILDVTEAAEDDDDDRDDRPRARPNPRRGRGRQGSGLWLWLGLGGGGLLLLIVIVVVVVVMMGGLGNKVTEENVKKIKPGMTTEQVVDILGKPDDGVKEVMGMSIMVWQPSNGQVSVTCMNGKVVGVTYVFRK